MYIFSFLELVFFRVTNTSSLELRLSDPSDSLSQSFSRNFLRLLIPYGTPWHPCDSFIWLTGYIAFALLCVMCESVWPIMLRTLAISEKKGVRWPSSCIMQPCWLRRGFNDVFTCLFRLEICSMAQEID